MKIGPNQRTTKEIKDQLLQARRAYLDGKEKLTERSITELERRNSACYAVLFVSTILLVWFISIVWPIRVEQFYDAFGFVPLSAVFFTSYFAVFHTSKLIVEPSPEELLDDTSYIAFLSACERRERRGLISAGLAIIHTAAFVSYLVIKETHWLDLPSS